MKEERIVKSKVPKNLTCRVEFWSEYLQAAHEFSNVTLVSGDGQHKATHTLLLAAVSDLLRRLLLEVYSMEERVVILLPDHSMKELELCFQAILAGEEKEGQEGVRQELGINVRNTGKDIGTNQSDMAINIWDYPSEIENQFKVKAEKISTKETKNISGTANYLKDGREDNEITYDQSVIGSQSESFQCQQCSSLFKNYIGLSIHLSVKHGSDWKEYIEKVNRLFRCKVCFKTLKKKSEIGKHISRVHKLGRQIMCHSCPEVFFYQTQLEDHMLVHSEDRDFVCDICGMKMKSKNRVTVHKANQHMSEEEKLWRLEMFKCNTCDKKYLNKGRLATHAESHGERIYQCEKCETMFRTKDAKRVHKKKKHSGIRPKQLTEEERKKKNEITRLHHLKMRQKQKEINGGVLRTGEERIKFNEYMKNWNEKRRAKKKSQ